MITELNQGQLYLFNISGGDGCYCNCFCRNSQIRQINHAVSNKEECDTKCQEIGDVSCTFYNCAGGSSNQTISPQLLCAHICVPANNVFRSFVPMLLDISKN